VTTEPAAQVTDLELAENLNRNVRARVKERAPRHPWPVTFYDGRAFAVSPDWTGVREWREGCWHYVDTQRVLAWLRKSCEA
jgi:hypothetical protein